MSVNQKYNKPPTDFCGSKEQKLYEYFKEKEVLGILEKHIQMEPYAGIVDNGLINFAFYSHFHFKVSEPDEITKNITLPLNLLGDEDRIINGIVKCVYTQETPIPLSKLIKWKKTEEDIRNEAAKYDITLLENPFVDDLFKQ